MIDPKHSEIFDDEVSGKAALNLFAQPLTLAALAVKPAGLHGYAVRQSILLMYGSAPRPARIYRVLRTMESEGLVESREEPGNGAPLRRVYSITAAGRESLTLWGAHLMDHAEAVRRVGELCHVA